ncbi:hypothetical protein ACOSP7_030101 [Xanthoceras sorbifolium]
MDNYFEQGFVSQPLTSIIRDPIWGCHNLESLPEGVHTLSTLSFLFIWSCPGFTSFLEGGIKKVNYYSIIIMKNQG